VNIWRHLVKQAVIFDLGNTLVSYFTRSEWPAILAEAIEEVSTYLRSRGLFRVDPEELADRVEAERPEPTDHRVKPLVGRLARIFRLSQSDLGDGVAEQLCRCFMKPTFAVARRYDDALPTLRAIRERSLRTGILSNTPWGSPADLWRQEVDRHGLVDAVDAVVFCCDVGYRKPARQPFEFVMRQLEVSADGCLFIGDDPRWDIVGPRGVGMEAILIDRTGSEQDADENTVRSLTELLERL